MDREQVGQLLTPVAYSHPVEEVGLAETHISWVLLTGEFAYKIRKPVRFGFVDFSTLDKRLADCRRELELNRAMSPNLYLGVEEIRDTEAGLRLGDGSGGVVDYAVKMRQFDQEVMFSRMAGRGALTVAHVESFADRVAALHGEAAVCADAAFGGREQIARWHEDNLSEIGAIVTGAAARRFALLAARAREELERRAAAFDARREHGFVRDCHGDLHLANILWIDGAVVLFDRIEFNDELRFIDVANDIAFTVMDLHAARRADLASRLVNRYLLRTGDFGALEVLRFYLAYRALVRAKVALLGCADKEMAARGEVDGYRSHADLAGMLLAEPSLHLAITCGLSGSGKTTRALAEAEKSGAVVVQTDVERKRLAEVDPFEHAGAAPGAGIYTADFSRRVYDRVARIAGDALEAGFPVIVDGAFLRRDHRRRFRRLAAEHGVPFRILYCRAAVDELRRRITARRGEQAVSDADLAVLEHQLATAELPGDDELAGAGP